MYDYLKIDVTPAERKEILDRLYLINKDANLCCVNCDEESHQYVVVYEEETDTLLEACGEFIEQVSSITEQEFKKLSPANGNKRDITYVGKLSLLSWGVNYRGAVD